MSVKICDNIIANDNDIAVTRNNNYRRKKKIKEIINFCDASYIWKRDSDTSLI